MPEAAVLDQGPLPQGVLGEIVARKRVDVAARMASAPIEELRARAAPTTRSLKAALARPGARFVLEVKRASPSQGEIRAGLDPHGAARAYLGAADAISVLTDGPWFGGSFEDLAAVRAEVDVPVLCKDFVLSPYQVVEARTHGADAVLLMLSVLDDAMAAQCLAAARRLGMDALVEVHDEAEMVRALALPAEVIGINNRDLKTLKVDLAVTERLAGMVPADRVVVSESGIGNRADTERLAPLVDAFLVGSALMREPDLRAAARALVFGRVKICGVARPSDMALVRMSGAAMAGIIFAKDSPRRVDGAPAAAIRAEAGDLPVVGVFRDHDLADVAAIAHELKLAAAQLHGSEDAAYVAALRQSLPESCEVWTVSPVDGEGARAAVAGADRTVFDASLAGRSGGLGVAFDWSLVADRPDLATGLLAGGLKPGNVRAAQALGAWALDVSSGVEAGPGAKSPELIAALFDALRLPSRKDL